ncbi:hypothetical protein I4U23_024936 [Adineta vaga]|nr:hypothetical protein I4U23_024936 [Adineta vaga]
MIHQCQTLKNDWNNSQEYVSLIHIHHTKTEENRTFYTTNKQIVIERTLFFKRMETTADSLTSSTTTTIPSPVSAASTFANLLLNEVNNEDVHNLLNVQRSFLHQLDKTVEKVDGINKLSTKRYLDASRDFSSHTQMLTGMKNDLDYIFKRIKLLKIRLNKKYPEAYSSVLQANAAQNPSVDDEEDDLAELISPVKSVTSPSLVKSKTIDCTQFSSLSAPLRESSSSTQLSYTDQTAKSFNTMLDKLADE